MTVLLITSVMASALKRILCYIISETIYQSVNDDGIDKLLFEQINGILNYRQTGLSGRCSK